MQGPSGLLTSDLAETKRNACSSTPFLSCNPLLLFVQVYAICLPSHSLAHSNIFHTRRERVAPPFPSPPLPSALLQASNMLSVAGSEANTFITACQAGWKEATASTPNNVLIFRQVGMGRGGCARHRSGLEPHRSMKQRAVRRTAAGLQCKAYTRVYCQCAMFKSARTGALAGAYLHWRQHELVRVSNSAACCLAASVGLTCFAVFVDGPAVSLILLPPCHHTAQGPARAHGHAHGH